MEEEFADLYLPLDKYGFIETELARKPSMVGPILQKEEYQSATVDISVFIGCRAVATAIAMSRQLLEVDLPIYYCLVRSDNPNALAARFSDWACIVISDALLQRILLLANDLSYSKYFAGYRSVHLFNWRVKRLPRRPRHEVIRKLGQPIPLNVEQWDLINTMTAVAALFTAHHEFAHIQGGHVRPKREQMAIAEIGQSADSRDLLTLRTLEFDADCLAAALTIEYLVFRSEASPEQFLRNPVDAMHTAAAAMHLAMLTIEAAQNIEVANVDLHAHAPALFRMRDIASTYTKVLQRLQASDNSFPPEASGFVFRRVLNSVEYAVAERTGFQGVFDVVDQRARYRDYNQAVLKRWAQIRPCLVEHNLGYTTLAPAQFDLDGKPLPRDEPR